jgi:hypothetical protein
MIGRSHGIGATLPHHFVRQIINVIGIDAGAKKLIRGF